MKTSNTLKKSLVLMTLSFGTFALTQSNCFAQTAPQTVSAREGSGSSNGNENRDALSYTQELNPDKLAEHTMDEAFNLMTKALRDLRTTTIPDYATAGDDFWNGLSGNAIAKVKMQNEALIARVDKAIQAISDIKPMVSSELGVIRAFEKEELNYTQNNLQNTWKEKLSSLRWTLLKRVKYNIDGAIDTLFNQVEDNYYQYNGYNTVFLTNAYHGCDSLACVNLMNDLAVKYANFLDQLKDQPLFVPNVIKWKSIKSEYRVHNAFKEYLKFLRNQNEVARVYAIVKINEKLIRMKANQTQNP